MGVVYSAVRLCSRADGSSNTSLPRCRGEVLEDLPSPGVVGGGPLSHDLPSPGVVGGGWRGGVGYGGRLEWRFCGRGFAVAMVAVAMERGDLFDRSRFCGRYGEGRSVRYIFSQRSAREYVQLRAVFEYDGERRALVPS